MACVTPLQAVVGLGEDGDDLAQYVEPSRLEVFFLYGDRLAVGE